MSGLLTGKFYYALIYINFYQHIHFNEIKYISLFSYFIWLHKFMPLYMAVRYIYCQAIQFLWTERKLTKEVIHAICMKYAIPSKGDLYTQIRNTNLRFCQIFVLPYTYCWHFLHLHRWLNYRTLKRKIELIPGLGKIGEHLMRDKKDDVKLIITQKDFSADVVRQLSILNRFVIGLYVDRTYQGPYIVAWYNWRLYRAVVFGWL